MQTTQNIQRSSKGDFSINRPLLNFRRGTNSRSVMSRRWSRISRHQRWLSRPGIKFAYRNECQTLLTRRNGTREKYICKVRRCWNKSASRFISPISAVSNHLKICLLTVPICYAKCCRQNRLWGTRSSSLDFQRCSSYQRGETRAAAWARELQMCWAEIRSNCDLWRTTWSSRPRSCWRRRSRRLSWDWWAR